MSPDIVAIVGFIVLFILMLLRVPVGMAMGLVGVTGFGYLVGAGPALKMVGQTSMRTVTDYTFGIIPMFLLMGQFAGNSGMSRELFKSANSFVGHFRGGPVVERFPVRDCDSLFAKIEKLTAHLHQPTDLDRVLQGAQPFDQATDFFLRIQVGRFDLAALEAGRMGQFGVIVIPHDVGQRLRRRRMGIDVRVRIDQRDRFELVKQPIDELL